jgi:predicted dehydrogenase
MASSNRQQINWGIIGSGWACREFAEGLKLVPGAQLDGVCSRSSANAEAFAQHFGATRVYSDISQLVADPGIHAVYIGTPNSLHAEHCCAALNAGKPTICEKPFTVDAAQACRVIELARRRNIFCMEAMRMRFLPAMQRVRRLLNDGAIGELRMLSATFGISAPYILDNRFFNPALGGGALLDLGVYAASLAHLVFGPPQRVVAAASVGPSGVDEHSAAIFSFADGKMAVLSASLRTDVQSDAVISGSKGEIRIEPLYRPEWVSLRTFTEQEAAPPAAQGGMRQLAKSIPGLRSAVAGGRRLMQTFRPVGPVREHVPFEGNGFNYQAAEVMRCLRSGQRESPIMPLDDTLKIMESLDLVRSQWGAAPRS